MIMNVQTLTYSYNAQWLLEALEWDEQTSKKALWNADWAALQDVGVTEDQFGACRASCGN
jgi:hypothetical protein